MATAQVGSVVQVDCTASESHDDPYNTVTFEAEVFGPDGKLFVVPGFWDGGKRFSFRIAGEIEGSYAYATRSNATADAGLHGVRGTVTVEPRPGTADLPALLQHGRLRVSANRRFLEHKDGKPFLWVGDTWWMGLTKRLGWPRGFRKLAADRVAKGFTVVHIVAGPYPDMTAFDPRGEGEGGFPFEPGFTAVRPRYFAAADRKIAHLVASGLLPCIVSMWGYYLVEMGEEKVRRFLRYLVARYGAYPVAWCAAGEGAMPFYLSPTPDADRETQRSGWTEMIREIRRCDPYRNPITIHPTQYGRQQVVDPSVLDFEMLQTGHGGFASIPNTVTSVRNSWKAEPVMPVIVAETNYEGILGSSHQDVQRRQYWYSILSGAAGLTYGANGIWQASTAAAPYGPSPHGRSWGNTPWQEAMALPGSAQVGASGAILRSIAPGGLDPVAGGVESEWCEASVDGAMAATAPGGVRVAYIVNTWNPPTVKGLIPGGSYQAVYRDPIDGSAHDAGTAVADSDGCWTPPVPPEVRDWVLVLHPLSDG